MAGLDQEEQLETKKESKRKNRDKKKRIKIEINRSSTSLGWLKYLDTKINESIIMNIIDIIGC